MMLVLDASMALAWIFARPAPGEQDCADRALQSLHGTVARVPVIWQLEVVNALLVGERRHVAPLATFDRQLAGAAQAAGGAVFA